MTAAGRVTSPYGDSGADGPRWGAPRLAGQAARDLDETAARLERWFSGRLPGSAPQVGRLNRPMGAGGSNETILFEVDITLECARATRAFVLRIEPGDFRLFMKVDLRQQFDLLTVLHEAGLKTPKVFWFEADASIFGRPFFIMERVEGRVPVSTPPYNSAGFLFDAEPAQRQRLWRSAVEGLASVHALPVRAAEILRPAEGANGWEADFDHQVASLRWAAQDWTIPFVEDTLAWLEANKPAGRADGLSWGDSRIGNMVFDDGFDLAAILDWEQASLGGPLRDLGWWLFFDDLYTTGLGLAPLEGMGTRQQTIDLWSAITGITPGDLDWYEVYAGFQLAVLWIRRCNLVACAAPGADQNNNHFTRKIARLRGVPAPTDMPG